MVLSTKHGITFIHCYGQIIYLYNSAPAKGPNLKDDGTPLVALSYWLMWGLDCAASCASYSGADPFAAMDRRQQMLHEGEWSLQGVMDPVLGAEFVGYNGEVVLASCSLASCLLAVGRRRINVVTLGRAVA